MHVNSYERLKSSFAYVECPVCRSPVYDMELIMHPRYREYKENKLSAIFQEIQGVPYEDKIIIFTQFHNLVDALTSKFIEIGIPFVILKGEPSEINISLNQFKKEPEIKVLLMSIEQAASGINVTEANHVFFVHPIFGMEYDKAALTYKQCIGRAFRIGQ
eukprot:CAMPEP_0114587388 /NCGR_PEP_ID=MMETSP0125-20121206/10353_1 /TAXON_ID=485358 ORGANISM="Aristerostoma sp., Strain ATCC 50986" /NCGR_SAMPLE_ID=MMETSP0125 /ASSEMBLY_ACC=CAM_ASM_000245 /LENGTH=159 /DNA_ID=CAMNT_0001783259 /DNA_START=2305 /DNA_END=2784 /DNA_ORIENTATION=+